MGSRVTGTTKYTVYKYKYVFININYIFLIFDRKYLMHNRVIFFFLSITFNVSFSI